MTTFRFSIRDLLWAMALTAMGLGWWMDHHQLTTAAGTWELRTRQLANYFGDILSMEIQWSEEGLFVEDLSGHGMLHFPAYPSTSLQATGLVEGPDYRR